MEIPDPHEEALLGAVSGGNASALGKGPTSRYLEQDTCKGVEMGLLGARGGRGLRTSDGGALVSWVGV